MRGEKRLAVQVEDHPLAYAKFEGQIPAGQYGAGTVTIWDWGWWEPEGEKTVTRMFETGHLSFVLHGRKMKGHWSLVRMRDRGESKPQWLLIKGRDD